MKLSLLILVIYLLVIVVYSNKDQQKSPNKQKNNVQELSKKVQNVTVDEPHGYNFGESQKIEKQNSQEIQILSPSLEFDQYDFSENFIKAIQNNQKNAKECISEDETYFSKHTSGQSPKYMWIGCSDSRVIPQKILGVDIGEVFVHRNVANQANPVDQNVMSALQYALDYLKIKTIIIAGHYECGGIKASLTKKDFGHLESWLSQIRELRYQNNQLLNSLNQNERFNKLIEMNVVEQARQISRMPLIQKHWKQNDKIEIVGVVYDIKTGLLKNVMKPLNGFEDIPQTEELI